LAGKGFITVAMMDEGAFLYKEKSVFVTYSPKRYPNASWYQK
jgi:hypothetical protein